MGVVDGGGSGTNDTPVEIKYTEMAPDGTWAGLRPQRKVLGLSWHWWIWITVIWMNVMDGAVAELWKFGSVIMNKDFGWTATQISAVRGHGNWISAGMALVTTYAYRRWFMQTKYGNLWMFILQVVGELMWGGFALLLAPHRYWVLFAMEIPYRFLSSWGGTAQYTIIINWFETRRGLALGLTGTAGEGGTPVLWGVLGAWFVTRVGYSRATFIASLFLLPAIPMLLIFMRNWPSDVGCLPWGADPRLAHHYAKKESKLLTPAERSLAGIPPAQRWGFNLKEAFEQPSYWLVMFSVFLSPLLWYFGAYGIGFHGRAVGLSTQMMGLAVSMYGFWYIIQGVILGHTFDWKGWDYRYAVAWGPVGGIVLAQAIMAFTKNVAGYMIGYMCVAMGVAAWTPMITAQIADTYGPLSLGLVWGIAGRAVTSVGIAIGFYLIGWTVDRYGNLYPAFKINWILGILCAAMFVFAFKPSIKAYRSIKQPPPWAFAKNAEAVRKDRRIAPIY